MRTTAAAARAAPGPATGASVLNASCLCKKREGATTRLHRVRLLQHGGTRGGQRHHGAAARLGRPRRARARPRGRSLRRRRRAAAAAVPPGRVAGLRRAAPLCERGASFQNEPPTLRFTAGEPRDTADAPGGVMQMMRRAREACLAACGASSGAFSLNTQCPHQLLAAQRKLLQVVHRLLRRDTPSEPVVCA